MPLPDAAPDPNTVDDCTVDINTVDNTTVEDGPLSTVEGCAAALAAGTATSQELVLRGLARIERYDGPDGLNAVITVASDALDQARASDERRARGQALGPLDGVPFTVKDCIEAAGMPTTHGSSLFTYWVPPADAPVVAALRDAGMVLLAKVSLDDFAAATWGESSLQGWMRNPHDPARTVGGSSGGSAVAVAAGYAPLSLGTDTGGSLRIPAALCGIATLRPTSGLLPLDGVFPRSPSQDVVGPMTTTVRGLRLALDALTGAPENRPGDDVDPATLRLGVVEGGLALWGDDPDGPVVREFRRLLVRLEAAGVELVPVPPPPRALLDAGVAIPYEAMAAVDEYLARPGMPVRDFEALFDAGLLTEHARLTFSRHRDFVATADGEARMRAARAELRTLTRTLLDTHRLDAVLYPSVQRVATLRGQEQAGVFTRWSEHTGFPAVALPGGRADAGPDGPPAGLPWSAELLGHEGADVRLLAVAAAVEATAVAADATAADATAVAAVAADATAAAAHRPAHRPAH